MSLMSNDPIFSALLQPAIDLLHDIGHAHYGSIVSLDSFKSDYTFPPHTIESTDPDGYKLLTTHNPETHIFGWISFGDGPNIEAYIRKPHAHSRHAVAYRDPQGVRQIIAELGFVKTQAEKPYVG